MIHTWADGFGVWHVRVSRTAAGPLIAARRGLRDELQAREANVARDIWMHPIRVPELDDEETIVYREGTIIPAEAGCEYVLDGTDTDGTEWHRCTTHDKLTLLSYPGMPCEGVPLATYVDPITLEGPDARS